MALKVGKADIWMGTIEDRAGGAAAKIAPMANAGANFEFVFARRMPEPARGCCVSPVKAPRSSPRRRPWESKGGRRHGCASKGPTRPAGAKR